MKAAKILATSLATLVLLGSLADAAPKPPGGVAALFSCSAGQRAFEHESLKHGVFFHHVLEGLGGKAKDEDVARRLWEESEKLTGARFEVAGGALS